MERGGQTIYTDELAQEILDRLSGGEPLAKICRDEHMPAVRTIYLWRSANDQFAARLARAREDGYDAIAVDALDIADETTNDTIATENGERPNAEWIARSKLRVWTRLELLKVWDPKRYGARQQIDVNDVTPLTPEQVEARLSDLFAKAAKTAAKKE